MTKRVPHKLTVAALALLALTGAASISSAWADWRDQVSSQDVDRLAHLNDAREAALAEARQRGGSTELNLYNFEYLGDPFAIIDVPGSIGLAV